MSWKLVHSPRVMFAGRAGSAPLGPGTDAWLLRGPGRLLDLRIRFPPHPCTHPLIAVINHMPLLFKLNKFKNGKASRSIWKFSTCGKSAAEGAVCEVRAGRRAHNGLSGKRGVSGSLSFSHCSVQMQLQLLSILGCREVCAPTRGCCSLERAALD